MGNNVSKVITMAVLSIELSAMGEIFYIYASQFNSSWPHVAMAHLTCGQCDCGTEISIYLILINLNVNSHLWPAAAILYGICPKDFQEDQWWLFLLLSVMSSKLSWHIKIMCLPLLYLNYPLQNIKWTVKIKSFPVT